MVVENSVTTQEEKVLGGGPGARFACLETCGDVVQDPLVRPSLFYLQTILQQDGHIIFA